MNPFALLKFIPWALLVFALTGWAVEWSRLRSVKAEYSEAKAKAAVERAEAIQKALTIERGRIKRQGEILDETKQSLDQARTERNAANSVVIRLRDKFATFKPATDPADTCAADRTAANRLAGVFQECIDRYREVAETADRTIIKGIAVEKAYDSLRK